MNQDLQPATALWAAYRPQEAPHRFDASDADGARAWQARVRPAFAAALGFLDSPPVPPEPVELERVDRGDCLRRKVLLRTAARTLMPVYLLEPKSGPRPFPVVLAFAGHGYGVKDIVGLWEDGSERSTPSGYHKDFALALCRRGFLVAAPEISCFGERQTDFSHLAARLAPVPTTCAHTAMLALHLGGSAAGLRVRDALRLVDWLATRDDCDIGRLGAMGISGGGMHTFFSACVDERIRACVVSGYFGSFRDSILAMHHCACNFVPGLGRFGEMARPRGADRAAADARRDRQPRPDLPDRGGRGRGRAGAGGLPGLRRAGHAAPRPLRGAPRDQRRPRLRFSRRGAGGDSSVILRMENLFSEIRVGTLLLAHRIMRSATHDFMADDDGRITDAQVELYRGLSRGGVALIVMGHAYVRRDGKCSVGMTGIDSDDKIPGLARVARAVHEAGDARVVAQINFGGAQVAPALRSGPLLAPSARDDVAEARAFDDGEAEAIVDSYVEAAGRAAEAGLDGVQIHGAHGYFVNQTLSPLTNRRTDRWGGAIDGRARMLLAIVEGIRRRLGRGFPLLLKIASHDAMPGGLELEDAVEAGRRAEAAGLDAIEVSGGMRPGMNMRKPIGPEKEGFFLDEARRFKAALGIPVASVNGWRSIGRMREAVASGAVDLISLSTAPDPRAGPGPQAAPRRSAGFDVHLLQRVPQAAEAAALLGALERDHPEHADADDPRIGVDLVGLGRRKVVEVLGIGPGDRAPGEARFELDRRREVVEQAQVGPLLVEEGAPEIEGNVALPGHRRVQQRVAVDDPEPGEARPHLDRLLEVGGVQLVAALDRQDPVLARQKGELEARRHVGDRHDFGPVRGVFPLPHARRRLDPVVVVPHTLLQAHKGPRLDVAVQAVIGAEGEGPQAGLVILALEAPPQLDQRIEGAVAEQGGDAALDLDDAVGGRRDVVGVARPPRPSARTIVMQSNFFMPCLPRLSRSPGRAGRCRPARGWWCRARRPHRSLCSS